MHKFYQEVYISSFCEFYEGIYFIKKQTKKARGTPC